ncbi:MAG: LysR family transcriptional regulator [Proteobacteria bacterium]|nr:LysR family transcriptional regulator [Pseudomonadota bacterium]
MQTKLTHLREHIEKLYSFSVVARTGSLNQASHNLRLSQAGLSHSIKVLETCLDTSLFIRTTKGMTLTRSGEILLDYCRKLFFELDALEIEVKNPDAQKESIARIGTHETLAIHVWPEFIAKLKQRHPSLNISLNSGRVTSLMQGLKSDKHHLIVTVEPTDDSETMRIPLYKGDFGFYVSTKNGPYAKWPKAKSIKSEDLVKHPMFTDTHAEIKQGASIPNYLMTQGFDFEQSFEVSSFESSIQLATRGLGVAFLPQRNAKLAVSNGLLRKLRIRGVSEQGFGQYQICATFLKANAKIKVIESILSELKSNFI